MTSTAAFASVARCHDQVLDSCVVLVLHGLPLTSLFRRKNVVDVKYTCHISVKHFCYSINSNLTAFCFILMLLRKKIESLKIRVRKTQSVGSVTVCRDSLQLS